MTADTFSSDIQIHVGDCPTLSARTLGMGSDCPTLAAPDIEMGEYLNIFSTGCWGTAMDKALGLTHAIGYRLMPHTGYQ